MAALNDDGGQGQARRPRRVHVLQPRHAGAQRMSGDRRGDALDEAFACYDLKQGGDDWDRKTVIVDDELRELFETVPRGGAARGAARHLPQRLGTEGPRRHPAGDAAGTTPAVPAATDSSRASTAPASIRAAAPRIVDHKPLVELTKTRGSGTKPVLYAACRPDQTASDATFDNRANGAFTYLFLKALAKDRQQTRQPAAECGHRGPQGWRLRAALDAGGPGEGEEGALRPAVLSWLRRAGPIADWSSLRSLLDHLVVDHRRQAAAGEPSASGEQHGEPEAGEVRRVLVEQEPAREDGAHQAGGDALTEGVAHLDGGPALALASCRGEVEGQRGHQRRGQAHPDRHDGEPDRRDGCRRDRRGGRPGPAPG